MKDYCQILGVTKNASIEEIKKAYRKKARKLHPDKTSGSQSDMKILNEAYNTLKDKKKKTDYDLKIFLENDEQSLFYNSIETHKAYPPYDNWKEDIYYRKIVIYLWVVLGFFLALIISMILFLNPLITTLIETKKNSNSSNYKPPQSREFLPRELDKGRIENLEDIIREI